jgi:hypothetical protein
MAEQDLREQVSRAAQEAGLDPEFVSRIVDTESKWNPLAVSKAGARGLMQVMPATAKQYGVTRLMDPAENIKAGVAYLKDLSQKYPGRPDLIAAAYNAGPGAVDKAGGVPNYRETQEYVQKVAGNGDTRTLAQRVRAKYPGIYDDLNDADLEAKVLAKHPGTYDDLPRTKAKAAAKTTEAAAQPDQPKAKEPEDYWGGFRKGWEEGGLGGFKGYVKGIVGAPGEVYRGIGSIIEDPAKALIGAAQGAMDLPGHIIQTTREAGTNPEAFGEMLGSGIGQTAVNAALGKAPGVVARAPGALMHVPVVGPVVRGAKILRDIGQAMSETGEAAAEVPKTVPKTTPVQPGPGPGGQGWYKPWEGAERERIVAGRATLAAESAAAPAEAAPAPSSGQPPLTKVWVAMNKLNTRLKATELPRATALVKDGMDPAEAVRKIVAERGGGSAAEELAKQLGTPSDAEVAADMGKRARSGQKSLMAKYGNAPESEPMHVYHGSPSEFERFDLSKAGSTRDKGFLGSGGYFSTDANVATQQPFAYETTITPKNPLRVTADAKALGNLGPWKQKLVTKALGIPENSSSEAIHAAAKAQGHDAVVLDYGPTGYKHQEIAVFDPDAIGPMKKLR